MYEFNSPYFVGTQPVVCREAIRGVRGTVASPQLPLRTKDRPLDNCRRFLSIIRDSLVIF